MRWSERQRAMLREMGVQLWERGPAAVASQDPRGNDAVEVEEPPHEDTRSAGASSPPASTLSQAPAPASAIEWRPADWFVVGEPFDAVAAAASAVGDQARLLSHLLQAVHVSRDAAERAGRACHFALAEGTKRDLDDALAAVRPRLILALGRAAAEALLDVDEPIGRLRGRVHQRAGVRVVVSFPLAYLLRNPSEKAKAWADLCLAVRSLDGDAGASAAPS